MAVEGKFEIDVQAKTTALNLSVRLRTSKNDVGTAHHLSGSVRARFRTWVVSVSLTLLQVLGRHAPRSTSATVRYSLRVRFRKLWLRIRGKHHVHSARPLAGNQLAPLKKPKWRRTLSSVGDQLLLLRRRNKSSSEKIANVVSQEPEKGFVLVQYCMDALRSDRAVMAMHEVGMASTLIVLVQLTGLPLFVILATGLAIAGRIVFVNRHSSSSCLRFQQWWPDAMSIGAISLVPQALRAVLRPYLPQSGFTASEGVMGTITLILVLLARYQRLPFKAMLFIGVLSAGIPAILVMWAPIVQLWSPADVNFMQILTGLVAVVSNCFLGYLRNGKLLSNS